MALTETTFIEKTDEHKAICDMVLLFAHPQIPTLFPYTTLFRSEPHVPRGQRLLAPVHGRPGSGNRSRVRVDRKSTRLNSSHVRNSYAVFCLKKKSPGFAPLNHRVFDCILVGWL